MLKITLPTSQFFDEENNLFIDVKGQELQLEHSLVSLSKWESTWLKPFLTKGNKTTQETLDYIRCMTLTQNVDPKVYSFIDQENMDRITNYINAPMTATTFRKDSKHAVNKETVTAELVYYWMIAFNIPFECQKWHLNRLLTLISVCNLKNQPEKKLSHKELVSRNRSLNDARKAKLNTKG